MSALPTLLAAVGEGRIQGGWEYVRAAYAVAWTGMTLYAISLWVRWPRGERR